MLKTDVLIIGGGMAGLTAALHLHRQGLTVQLLEATDRVGGRIKTDIVEGFRLDHGFQILLTEYPEAKELLDYEALELKKFLPGALILAEEGKIREIGDPTRWPGSLLSTAFGPVGTVADKMKAIALRTELGNTSIEEIFEREEKTTAEILVEYGFSESIIGQFLRPFMAGVFLENELSTSRRMFDFTFKMFAEGDVAIPAKGMEQIPIQLANQLPAGTILTNKRVEKIEGNKVITTSGEEFEARKILVATEAIGLAGTLRPNTKVAYHSTINLYFAARKAPTDKAVIVLQTTGGLINNLCVLSNVSPDYAPEGEVLISVALVGLPGHNDETLVQQVLTELEPWYGEEVQHWEHLKTYRVKYALPNDDAVKNDIPKINLQIDNDVFICGDHLLNGSLNAAIKTGRLAAELIAEKL